MGRMKAGSAAPAPVPADDLFGWAAELPPARPARLAPAPRPKIATAGSTAAPAVAVRPAPPPPAEPPRNVTPPVARSAASTTLYIVVPYSDRAAGKGAPRWRPGAATAFGDPNRALRAAEGCIGRGGVVGAIVGRQTADADAGDYAEPEIIGRFGRVPPVED